VEVDHVRVRHGGHTRRAGAGMRLETFSYLPPLSADEVRAQLENLARQGLIPGIEHSIDPTPRDSYWQLWKLPFIDRPDADTVLAEVDACAVANPRAHVKLVGYDSVRQGQVVSFVVRAPAA
jgi:ribulose-bisphosphate carboxylase small chain